MKQMNFSILLLVLLLTNVIGVKAQQRINVVTTAVPLLRISPDARAGGMGETGIATEPDAVSSFWNLAKTPFNQSKGGIGFTYTPWLKKLGLNDVYLLTMAGYYKLDDAEALSASIRYFSLGNIQFTDNLGNDFGGFRPREFAVDAGYSRKLSPNAGLGLALRYINSNLTGNLSTGSTSYKVGSTVAADVSYYHTGKDEAGSGWNYGATLTNLGGKVGYTSDAKQNDFIPANLGLGASYTKVYDEANRVTFGVDVNKLLVPTPPDVFDSARIANYRSKTVVSSWFSSFNDAPGGLGEELKEFQVSLGAEYWYTNQFALRAGYFYEDKTKGNRKYFTLGAGLKYNVFEINFSYIVPSGNGINQNPLSNTLRFGLVFDLSGENTGSQ